ncbi:MAG: hypothetical protein FJX34_01030 [Alphaproteobacteria bacterium]|nr:hypothetical protein [Alphaproteobacteria bacterium]
MVSFPFTGFKVPPGTAAFQSGYKDGCGGVLYARGNVLYRTRYDFHYDPKMIGNPDYKFGYSRGWSWCFQQVIQPTTGVSRSPDRYLLPYGQPQPFDTSPSNINNAWGGFFATGLEAPGNSTSTAGGIDGSLSILQKGIAGGSAGAGQAAFDNPLWSGQTGVSFMGIW